MWISRQLDAIGRVGRPVVLLGGEPFGVPHIIAALRSSRTLAWVELNQYCSQGPIYLGNSLAYAINSLQATPLLPLALPYSAQLRALQSLLPSIGPLWLVVTTTQQDSPLLEALLRLHQPDLQVLLDLRLVGEPLRAELREECDVLGPAELRVSLAEAQRFAPRAVDDELIQPLLLETDGRYADVVNALLNSSGLPSVATPRPRVEAFNQALAQQGTVAESLHHLTAAGEAIAAFETAAHYGSERVEELLPAAALRYREAGLLGRLHQLLVAMPEGDAPSQTWLEWRLQAAYAAGELAKAIPAVDAYLRSHIAPPLRALRAEHMPREQGFELARQAYEAERTALTLWQYGRLHPDNGVSIDLLQEAVQLAEDEGDRFEILRAASSLVSRLNHAGQYARAAGWGRWANDVLTRAPAPDGPTCIRLLNDLAVAGIMSGEFSGLQQRLDEAQALAQEGLPRLATLVRCSAGRLALAEGRARDALELHVTNYRLSPRHSRVRHGYQLIRAQLELELFDAALRVADDIGQLAARGNPYELALAALARGMVGAVAEGFLRWQKAQAEKGHPLDSHAYIGSTGAARAGAAQAAAKFGPGAATDLETAFHEQTLSAAQRLSGALHYLLAGGRHAGLPSDVVTLLSATNLQALKGLSGPSNLFEGVWSELAAQPTVLRFSFLGAPEVLVEGRPVELSPRVAEVALALVLNPHGISRDALNDFLTADGSAPFTSGGMRGMMTRVRSFLPVSDAPYRLTTQFSADLLDLREHLERRRLRQAVALYRQPLLELSDAAGVVETRLELEEELRQAVLLAGDANALFDLAKRLDNDLQCWEAAMKALVPGDPRLAVSRARVARLSESYLRVS